MYSRFCVAFFNNRLRRLFRGVQGWGCRTSARMSPLCRFQPSSATSVPKCRQLMSLCPSLFAGGTQKPMKHKVKKTKQNNCCCINKTGKKSPNVRERAVGQECIRVCRKSVYPHKTSVNPCNVQALQVSR